MENGMNYLKQNWLPILIYLIVFIWVASILNQPHGLLVLALTVILIVAFELLSKKVFKLHKKGPIPWYGSSILWVGGTMLCVLVFWYAIHT